MVMVMVGDCDEVMEEGAPKHDLPSVCLSFLFTMLDFGVC